VANRNPLCRPYTGLVISHWAERHGFESVLQLLARVSGGEPANAALEAQFGSPLNVLDAEARTHILDRFDFIRLDPWMRMTPGALASTIPQTDTATVELARMYLARQRYDDAERALSPLLAREAPPTAALLLSGRAAFGQGDYVKAKEQIGLGLDLERLRSERTATSKDYESLGLALVKLGDANGARDAFRTAIVLNPLDTTENGPYAQLLSLLGEQKTNEYYATLEQRLLVRRADPRPRMELAQWYEAQGNPEKALQYYRSAAGIRPGWVHVHRHLAPLAQNLGMLDLAHASYRVLHLEQPEDVRILEHLTECERRLANRATSNSQASSQSE
jgi:tetratricopeptide (TPR) repeat protein